MIFMTNASQLVPCPTVITKKRAKSGKIKGMLDFG